MYNTITYYGFSVVKLAVIAILTLSISCMEPSPKSEQIEIKRDTFATVKGMTISCQSWGWEWGSDDMVTTMAELKKMGVNWIAIHPYARIDLDGNVKHRHLKLDPDDRDDDTLNWLTRPINEAHRLGMKIMIKPHLAYWGSGFRWRGDIKFDEQEQWDQFFTSYRSWVTRLADVCHDADSFVVGTELDATINHDTEWREIIRSVRGVFDNPITYAANWDSYDKVLFWDELDVIGIQAYFPLVDQETDVELPSQIPTRAQIEQAWAEIMKTLREFSDTHEGKAINFTELGYNRSLRAAIEPWSAHSDPGIEASELQQLCLDVALKAIAEEDVVCGSFLWKWFPGSPTYGNFVMASTLPRQTIRQHWVE